MQINLNNSKNTLTQNAVLQKTLTNLDSTIIPTIIHKHKKKVHLNLITFLQELLLYPILLVLRILQLLLAIIMQLLVFLQTSYKKIRFILFARSKSRKFATFNIAILHAVLLIATYTLINKLYVSAQNINYLVNTHHPPLLISQADGFLKQDVEIDVLGQANLLLTQTHVQAVKKLSVPYVTYRIQPGDTIYTIALKYGVSTTTIINANHLSNPNYLKIGQVLKVPLKDGILYTVKKGDTLASIAKKYKIKIETLAKTNNLKTTSKLTTGTLILVPGITPKPPVYAKKTTTRTNTNTSAQYASGGYFVAPSGSCSFALKYVGYGLQNYKVKPAVRYIKFIKYNPVAGSYRLGSGFAGYRWGTYYWHSGIDYIANYGTPVIAVADGVINRTGYQAGGYGYYVKIYHPQVGMYTLYGHLSRYAPGIRAGTKVKAGQVIGYIGHSGLAYGNHLHFEVIDKNRLRYNAACFK